jgi:adenosyl cobinamide kinase/adenosyl cobinamide phosphate guanylyltransferase
MLFVVGGIASGKRKYLKSIGYTVDDMSKDIHSDKKVIYDADLALLNEGLSPEDVFSIVKDKEVVTCHEVGSGVMPVNEKDRRYIEDTGKLSIMLAEKADKVVRVVCGIPMTIKG